MTTSAAAALPWTDAVLAAAVMAVEPAGLGIRLRVPAGPAREAWLALLRMLLPPDRPVRRCPSGIADDRLLGGLDLTASLAAGARIAHAGLLADSDGGVVVLPMAERVTPALAARLSAVLDTGEVALERDGLAARLPARIGVVALDEGRDEDEPPPASLLDRLALALALDERVSATLPAGAVATVASARARLASVVAADAVMKALCNTALLAGIGSIRAPLLALRVARIVAALRGRDQVSDEDAATAARLVLAPRAMQLPETPGDPEAATDPASPGPEPEPGPAAGDASGTAGADDAAAPADGAGDEDREQGGDTADLVLQAVRTALPHDLLLRLRPPGCPTLPGTGAGGRAETRLPVRRAVPMRGRPVGVRSGDPSRGRLNLLATLRAAAPWQAMRRTDAAAGAVADPIVRVRREDFRLTRFAPRLRITTIFVVDASGSSARSRLAEAKGCVELLLADCYARRDQVALVAFRGRAAELVLPPTGSVVRARRALDGLPGGGGTPLASGLDAAVALGDQLRRRGETAMLVLLTDGRANVSRAGVADRVVAAREAQESAGRARLAGLPSLLVDISPRPNDRATELAACMGARYLLLPQASPHALDQAVRAARPLS